MNAKWKSSWVIFGQGVKIHREGWFLWISCLTIVWLIWSIHDSLWWHYAVHDSLEYMTKIWYCSLIGNFHVAENGMHKEQGWVLESHRLWSRLLGVYFPHQMYSHCGLLIWKLETNTIKRLIKKKKKKNTTPVLQRQIVSFGIWESLEEYWNPMSRSPLLL